MESHNPLPLPEIEKLGENYIVASERWPYSRVQAFGQERERTPMVSMDSVSTSSLATAQVAVITRTKNRPILLKRALESVRRQTVKDLLWVVINDGGETQSVDAIAGQAKAANLQTVVIHNPRSLGMEAASNKAIHAVDSQYIIIHDDDDSWEPTFLERTTQFLETNPSYGGVITHVMRIEEIIESDSVRLLRKDPFNDWLASVYLVDMLNMNVFPPISFLYKREAFAAVGNYNQSLPVLGDWDFNIRFLQKYNIGVVPELLANYHHRVPGQQAAYGNTITAGIQQHVLYDTMIRNNLLRQDLEEGRFGVGCLMSMLRWNQIILNEQRSTMSSIQWAKRKLRGIPGFSPLLRGLRKLRSAWR